MKLYEEKNKSKLKIADKAGAEKPIALSQDNKKSSLRPTPHPSQLPHLKEENLRVNLQA